mgnify:FL=1
MATVNGNETTNTIAYDKLGNQVVVPAGFEVVNPTATVQDGIIIKDKANLNEFVWIPVGQVKQADGNIVNINFSRYTFDEVGNGTDIKKSSAETYFQELTMSDKGNTTAKDINAFKISAVSNKGYYIGRYEARTQTKRTASGNALTQLTEKPNEYVYNYVTQPQAASLSRNMYNNTNFTSDLVNSYAWDTAITFLQAFDNRTTSKVKAYSRQTSLNTTAAETGTNNLSTKDKICNLYDMASNAFEWTTETSKDVNYTCTRRGGCWKVSNNYTSGRGFSSNIEAFEGTSFRPIIYLNP